MKRLLFLLAAILISTVGVYAQKYAFVNTETIFKSIPEYTKTIQEIDQMAVDYQSKVDAEYTKIAEMYDRYQYQKSNLSEAVKKQVEDNILKLEKAAGEMQKKYFDQGGELMKKRLELLKPIQDKVFKVVDTISTENGYDMIIDISNNPSIVSYNKTLDLSKEVLKKLGISK